MVLSRSQVRSIRHSFVKQRNRYIGENRMNTIISSVILLINLDGMDEMCIQ